VVVKSDTLSESLAQKKAPLRLGGDNGAFVLLSALKQTI
jgi:hypothetical protein